MDISKEQQEKLDKWLKANELFCPFCNSSLHGIGGLLATQFSFRGKDTAFEAEAYQVQIICKKCKGVSIFSHEVIV